jgi:hypothetical protein
VELETDQEPEWTTPAVHVKNFWTWSSFPAISVRVRMEINKVTNPEMTPSALRIGESFSKAI